MTSALSMHVPSQLHVARLRGCSGEGCKQNGSSFLWFCQFCSLPLISLATVFDVLECTLFTLLISYPAHLLCTGLAPSPSPLYWPHTQPISSVLASYPAHLLCTGLVPSPSPLYWPRTQPISSVLVSYPAHLLCTSLVPSQFQS